MKIAMQPFKQEGTQMYCGVMRVEDLLKYCKVDLWRQEDGSELGYQRAPEPARMGKVAKFLQSDPKPLMPTSVLLGYRGTLKVADDSGCGVLVEVPEGETLWVVDGQHRIFGVKRAIEEMGVQRLNDYLLPVVIVEFTTLEEEANQFRIVNETMKKVRTDLARRILALRLATRGRPARQELMNTSRLWEANAVEVLKLLANDEDSPWLDRIQAPNMKKQSSHVIRELSFSTSLKPILNVPPYKGYSPQRVAKILKEYWKAWESLVPDAFSDANSHVLLKTPGVFSLHLLGFYVLEVLRVKQVNNPSQQDFCDILKDLGQYLSPDFWSNEPTEGEGAAMAGSMKGFSILAETMQEELENAGHTTG